MSAEPLEPPLPAPGRVHRVPRTIGGISDWLAEEQREQFIEEIMAAKEEEEYKQVLDNWWAEVHLAQDPYREERRRRAMSADRSELVSLEDLKRRWFPEANAT